MTAPVGELSAPLFPAGGWEGFSASMAAHAVSRRAAPVELPAWLDGLPPSLLPHGRAIIGPSDVPGFLDALFTAAGTPDDAGRAALRRDIYEVASGFARFLGISRVHIRLDKVTDDACWRFHRDNVRVRALCTYLGPGTQYAPDCWGPRAVAEQRDYDGLVCSAPRFAVVLLKGWKSPGHRAAVHRSPPVEGTGAVRLVLCLNEPPDAADWGGSCCDGAGSAPA